MPNHATCHIFSFPPLTLSPPIRIVLRTEPCRNPRLAASSLWCRWCPAGDRPGRSMQFRNVTSLLPRSAFDAHSRLCFRSCRWSYPRACCCRQSAPLSGPDCFLTLLDWQGCVPWWIPNTKWLSPFMVGTILPPRHTWLRTLYQHRFCRISLPLSCWAPA